MLTAMRAALSFQRCLSATDATGRDDYGAGLSFGDLPISRCRAICRARFLPPPPTLLMRLPLAKADAIGAYRFDLLYFEMPASP